MIHILKAWWCHRYGHATLIVYRQQDVTGTRVRYVAECERCKEIVVEKS